MDWQVRRRLAQYHNWIFERRHVSTWVMLALVLSYVALELQADFPQWSKVNWMIVTGLPVGWLFIWSTNNIKSLFEKMADGLNEQELLHFASARNASGERLIVRDAGRRQALHDQAKRQVEEDAAIWGFSFSLAFVPLCLVVLHYASGDETVAMKAFLYLTVVIMAVACGMRIGRMACYGWQGLQYRTMEVDGCSVTLVPRLGHPDGGAGLAPIGRFYSRQVGRMAWLIVFLLVWLVLLGVSDKDSFITQQYPGETSLGLFALLVLILTLQILGFFVPMSAIHRQLGCWKDAAMKRNFAELKQVEQSQQNGQSPDDPGLVLRKIDLRHEREDIAAMGLWPVSMDTLRQFWLGKFASLSIAVLASYNDITVFMFDTLQYVSL